MQIQVRKDNRDIVGMGYFPDGVDDDNIRIIDVPDHWMKKLLSPGRKRLNTDDNDLTVTPNTGPDLLQEQVKEHRRKRALLIAEIDTLENPATNVADKFKTVARLMRLILREGGPINGD